MLKVNPLGIQSVKLMIAVGGRGPGVESLMAATSGDRPAAFAGIDALGGTGTGRAG